MAGGRHDIESTAVDREDGLVTAASAELLNHTLPQPVQPVWFDTGVPRTSELSSEPAEKVVSVRVETWTSPAFLAWAIITAASTAYLLRGIRRFLHPGFWAEDGRNFFADAFNQGIASIFEPYNGYLHFIPRLVALPMSAAPLSAVPALFALSAAVMYLVMISPVLSDRIAWLIPNKVARSIAYLLLCLLPVMNEVYGSTANLIFIGGITLFLFVISDDPTTRGRAGSRAGGDDSARLEWSARGSVRPVLRLQVVV